MEKLESRLSEISIDTKNDQSTVDMKWNWPLKDLYRLALGFYKGKCDRMRNAISSESYFFPFSVFCSIEKSGKAVQFSYEDNLKLVAFTQQAAHGPVSENAPPIGAFDVIGRDRRLSWQHLGQITKEQAMDGFIDMLDRLCPAFRPYVEAVKKDKEEKLRQQADEERRRQEQLEVERQHEKEQQLLEEQRERDEMQKRRLQDALNQQTYHQFRAYAEKQYPGNPEQQAILIRQLQNEHYHQYMQQLHAQMSIENAGKLSKCDGNENTEIINNSMVSLKDAQIEHDEEKTDDEEDDLDGFPPISPASMWTTADIEKFKTDVSAGKGEGVIKVGHGDIVTVRVPTHEGGRCLYWEFATDSYDIGFGVYFEWGKPTSNEVSVQISDSDDDEEGLDGDDDDDGKFGESSISVIFLILFFFFYLSIEIPNNNDIESGGSASNELRRRSSVHLRPPISTVVPVYRRECHSEVYVGSHTYPGEGVYLLKFDNSYSLWRSKTLYYRVYYTR